MAIAAPGAVILLINAIYRRGRPAPKYVRYSAIITVMWGALLAYGNLDSYESYHPILIASVSLILTVWISSFLWIWYKLVKARERVES